MTTCMVKALVSTELCEAKAAWILESATSNVILVNGMERAAIPQLVRYIVPSSFYV